MTVPLKFVVVCLFSKCLFVVLKLNFRKDVYLATYNSSIITDIIAKTMSNEDEWMVNTTTYMNFDNYHPNDTLIITLETDGDPIKVVYPITEPLDKIEVIFSVPKVSFLHVTLCRVYSSTEFFLTVIIREALKKSEECPTRLFLLYISNLL